MKPEVISQPLSIPTVAQAAMAGNSDERYAKRPAGKGEWSARADTLSTSVSQSWLESLAPAIAATGAAAARLNRSSGERGVVVTTGQQPGLFGGPVYTLSKALSALALANALEKLIGIPVAPVFWAATDDTDFREASKIAVSVTGGARDLVMEQTGAAGASMSRMPLGDVSSLFSELSAACGSGASTAVLASVERSYSHGQTVGGAYVSLLRELLEPLGIAVLDASHESVRQASAPLVKLALERADDIAKAIASNDAAIEKEGHSLQVQDVAGLSLVFENTEGGRKRIPRKRGVRDLKPGAELGPNVLLRPVVESNILPTVAYVGGPAEIAYFAQLAPVADTLGVPRPLIVPRWSCTILEPHIRKIIAALDVDLDELADPHAVETKVARRHVPDDLKKEIAAFRSAVEERASATAATASAGSPLIRKGIVDGLRHNLLHRLDRFERRVIAAAKRKHSGLMQDVATARGSLFPAGKPQERALSFVPFLARYGKSVQDEMLDAASDHAESLL